MKKILMGNRYIRRYYEDPIFNSRVILYRGLLINILYALFKLITGVYYRSTWMIAISVYYITLIIFAIAAYTFYRIGIAVVRILKNRKRKDILFSAARAIDFCFAVTSMFTLQTAMFSSFAIGMDTVIPNIITGTAAAVIVTVIAVYMLMTSRNNLSDPMRDKG